MSRFLAKGHLPRGLRQSRLSANDKGDNETIPEGVHRSPDITLFTSTVRPSMKAVRTVIASNRVPYIQMRSVGSHSTSGMEKEGKKKKTR